MITDKSPYDYNRRTVIIPQLVRVCGKCGSNTSPRPADNVEACMSCGSTMIVELWENMLDTYRAGLMHKQVDAARTLAAMLKPKMRHFLEMVALALDE